jgi:hypothetical protein
MSTKVFIEILTEDDSSTALSKVSELLGDYTISSIKTSPANTLRRDSKDFSALDDLNNLDDPNQIQKAIKENRLSELKTNNNKRLDSLKNAQIAKEIIADQAVQTAKEEQTKRIENANKY